MLITLLVQGNPSAHNIFPCTKRNLSVIQSTTSNLYMVFLWLMTTTNACKAILKGTLDSSYFLQSIGRIYVKKNLG
jgi:hypothetical protein